MGDRVVGRVQLDEVDDIEPRAAEQAEQLAVRDLPLHPVLTGPFQSPETALRPLKRFGRRAFDGRTKRRERAVTEEPEPSARAKQTVGSFRKVPKLGISVPNMGTNISTPSQPTGLANALFFGTKQRVLGLLFGQPSRSVYANELIGLAASGSGAVQRELANLAASGLIAERLQQFVLSTTKKVAARLAS